MRRWLFLIALFVPVMAQGSQAVGTVNIATSTAGGNAVAPSMTNTAGNFLFTSIWVSCTVTDPNAVFAYVVNSGTPNQDSNGNPWNVSVDSQSSFQATTLRALYFFWTSAPINGGANVVTYKNNGFSDCKVAIGIQNEYAGFFTYNPGSYRANSNIMPFVTPDLNTTFPINANATYVPGPSPLDLTFTVALSEGGTGGTWSANSTWSQVATNSPTGYQMVEYDGTTSTTPTTIQIGNTGSSFTFAVGEWIVFNRVPTPSTPPIQAGCKAGYAGASAGPPATGLTCVMPTVNAGDNLFLVNTQNTGNHIASITGCDSGATLGWTKKWESLQGQVYYLLGATSQTNCTVTLTFDGSGAVFFTSMIVFRCTDCNAYPVSVQPKGYGAAGSYQATMSDIAVGSNEPDSFLVAMAAGYNSSNPFGFSTASSGWSAIDGITSYSPSRTQGTSTYAFYKEVTSAGSYPITISNGGIGSFLGSTFWMALRRTAPVYGTLQTGFATTARVGGTTPTTSLTVQFEQQPPPLSRVELTVFSHTFATSLPFAISTTGGLICPTELPWIAPGLNDVGDTIAPTVMCTVPASPSGTISATFTDAGTPIDWDLLAVNDLNLVGNTSTGTALWASSMFNSPTTVTTMDTGPMFVQPNGSASSLFLQGLVSGSTSQQSDEVDLLTPSSPYVPRFQPEYNLMLNEWFDGTLTVSGTVPTGQDFSVTSVRGQVDSATQQAAWGIGAPYTFPVIVAQRLANAFGGPTTIDITEPSIGGALVLCVASNPGTWALPTTSPSVTWHLLVGGGASDWLEQAVAFNVPAGKISITQQQVGTNNTFFSVTKVTKISAIDASGYSGAGTVTSPVTTGVTPHDATDYLSVCGGTLDNLSGAGGGIDGPAGTYLSNKFLGKTDGNAANVFDSYLQTPATYSLTYTIDSGGPAALGMTAFNYIAPPVANVQPFVNLITKNDPARYMGEWRK